MNISHVTPPPPFRGRIRHRIYVPERQTWKYKEKNVYIKKAAPSPVVERHLEYPVCFSDSTTLRHYRSRPFITSYTSYTFIYIYIYLTMGRRGNLILFPGVALSTVRAGSCARDVRGGAYINHPSSSAGPLRQNSSSESHANCTEYIYTHTHTVQYIYFLGCRKSWKFMPLL